MDELQLKFLVKIGIDPSSSLDAIEESVGDYLVSNGLDEDYNPTEEGLICESILDWISDQ